MLISLQLWCSAQLSCCCTNTRVVWSFSSYLWQDSSNVLDCSSDSWYYLKVTLQVRFVLTPPKVCYNLFSVLVQKSFTNLNYKNTQWIFLCKVSRPTPEWLFGFGLDLASHQIVRVLHKIGNLNFAFWVRLECWVLRLFTPKYQNYSIEQLHYYSWSWIQLSNPQFESRCVRRLLTTII